MRILSISGQNIASLAAKFHIDFTAPPLAGAGLFAIIGETGAGKSSILDAMCLALYGEAPRLAGGALRDEVPDPSGNSIKANDARSILRRGAAQAWAEVRFTAKDGQEYSVKWNARRARDRADGSLQSVSRHLIRLSDQQILASQIKQVDEQVQDLTGFSYSEFRRTVLLAQGDFDAFLRADTNERAALLEKVTGSDIFRAISKRIYERNEAAKQAKEALLQRVGEHELLDEDTRAAYFLERQEKAAQAFEYLNEINAVRVNLDLYKAHKDALENVEKAKVSLRLLQQADQSSLSDRNELALIDKAQPLQTPWQEVKAAELLAIKSKYAVEARIVARNSAHSIAEQQRQKTAAAEQIHRAHEDEFKRLGPIWSAAADLDSRIDVAQREALEAQDALFQNQRELENRRQTLAQTSESFDTVQKDIETVEKALSSTEDLVLAAKWEQIAAALREVIEAETCLEQNMLATQSLHKARTALAEGLDQVTQQLKQSEIEETARRQAFADLENKLSDLAKAHPPERAVALAQLSALLERLSVTQKDIIETGTKRDLLHAEIAQAEKEKALTEAQTAQAQEALQSAQQKVASLQPHAQRAELAASDTAQHLRLHLQKGCPCPVCGATEHPAAADKALISIAEGLRADLETTNKTAEAAQLALTSALQRRERHSAHLEHVTQSETSAVERLNQLNLDWRNLHAQASAFDLCPLLPDAPQGGALPSLGAAQDQEARAQAEISTLRQQMQRMQQDRDSAEATSRKLLQEKEKMSQDANKFALQERQTIITSDAANATIAKHKELLRPWRGEGRLAPSIVASLQNRVDNVLNLQAEARRLDNAKQDLLPKLAEEKARHQEALRQLSEAENRHTARKLNLQEISLERSKLLQGVATSEHRSRFNLARQAAQEAYQTEIKALNQADADDASALAYWQSALDYAAQTAETLRLKTDIFEEVKASTGIAETKISELLTKPTAEVMALREKLTALDEGLRKAKSDLTLREIDLSQISLPPLGEEELNLQLENLRSKEAELHQRQGVISEILTQDAEKRKKIEGLQQEITQAQAEADIWAAVNRAAGSRNGDSFVKVAQSLTLDVLIAHANHHLADLAPRYRLRRGADLALQVEDRDMGGEPRATRSLSGGERFLVSLALALALSRLGGKGGLAGTLFIDEGFGSLDPTSLNQAIEALETLQSQGRQVGVISHVEAMKERIPTRILVKKMGSGRSEIEIS